jgi:putative glycosyltransferase (TIGR04372 family)
MIIDHHSKIISHTAIGSRKHKIIDMFCCGYAAVCNQQLKQMWERTVHVSRFARAAERVNRWLPGGLGNRIPFDRIPNDTHGLLAQLPAHLSFTPEEKRQGHEALRKLGIPEGSPFVCLMARDNAYYADKPRYTNKRFRNSDILTYLPAVEALVQRGYVVVRMGAAVERPLVTDNPRIIDYASIARTDFLDIFLCAHCHLYLGDGGGLRDVPMIFRRPVALVNCITLEYAMTWNPQDLFIPKILWLRSEGRAMTLREILESGVGRYQRDGLYEQHGVEVIDNTPEEITALALEAEARRAGTWKATEEDEELQRRFWEIFRTYATLFASAPWRTHWRIGTEFLRQHRALLEPSTTPRPTRVGIN